MHEFVHLVLRQLSALADLTLAPPDCAACGGLVDVEWPSFRERTADVASSADDAASVALAAAFCSRCRPPVAPVRRRVAELDCVATGRHAGSLRHAVHALKYRTRADLAPRLGQVIAPHCVAVADTAPRVALVPIPLHPLRLATRGYNQSALMARAAARSATRLSAVQFRPLPLALTRTRSSNAQASLGGAERRENQRGAFAVRARPRDPVILIDDVCTTGATARAAADALLALDVSVLGLVTLTIAGKGDLVDLPEHAEERGRIDEVRQPLHFPTG